MRRRSPKRSWRSPALPLSRTSATRCSCAVSRPRPPQTTASCARRRRPRTPSATLASRSSMDLTPAPIKARIAASPIVVPRRFPMRILRSIVAGGLTLLLAAAPAFAQVKVGSKNFTEQFIVAEIYAQALEAAGVKVERKINLGGTLIAHKALEEKQIDLYPEYTGTMLLAVLKAEPMTDRKAVYDKVKGEYAKMGLVVLNEAPLNNSYDMVVRPETAAQYKLETLSDLAKVSKELKLGAGPEFRDRKDGLPGLKAKYDM